MSGRDGNTLAELSEKREYRGMPYQSDARSLYFGSGLMVATATASDLAFACAAANFVEALLQGSPSDGPGEALRMACRELVTLREFMGERQPWTPPPDWAIDDVVAEFLGKARGYKAEEE